MIIKTTKVVGFVAKALSFVNKSDDQKQQEAAERFVEDTTIDLEAQISNRETEIKKLGVELKSKENALKRAKEDQEKTIYTIASSTESYLNAYNQAKRNVKSAETAIANIKTNIATYEAEIVELNDLLTKFKA